MLSAVWLDRNLDPFPREWQHINGYPYMLQDREPRELHLASDAH